MRLIDRRTQDGSRHFASLPKTCTWQALCEHILLLPGARIADFVAVHEAGTWIDFTFQGYRFSVSHRNEEFCFFVREPQCPDLSLYRVASHCQALLESS